MLPTNRSQIVNPILTNLARQFKPDEAGFIADRVAPRVPVKKESGQYPVFDQQYFFGAGVNPLKPDRAASKEVDISWSTESYLCEEYALNFSISDRERQNIDSEVRLQESKQNAVQSRLLIARERRVAASYAACTKTVTPSVNWDQDTATIEADVKAGIAFIRDTYGILPNTIIIPATVADEIAVQADIREIFKYTVNGQALLAEGVKALPPRIWGLEVIVPSGIYTADEDAATPTYSTIWSDNVYIAYINRAAQWGQPTAVTQFVSRDWQTRQWVENNPSVDKFETGEIVDEVRCGDALIYEMADLL